jgi:hypothetical protein
VNVWSEAHRKSSFYGVLGLDLNSAFPSLQHLAQAFPKVPVKKKPWGSQ